MVVDFYFGIGSRYSYLASTQLAALGAETGAQFDWLALDSARLIAAAHGGRSPIAPAGGTGQYDWGYRTRDAEAWAEFYGVPYREPRGRLALDPDLFSLACTAARRFGAAETYARALFRAVFADDLPAVDRAVCLERAGEVGLDRGTFADALDDQSRKPNGSGSRGKRPGGAPSACRPSPLTGGCSGATTAWCCSATPCCGPGHERVLRQPVAKPRSGAATPKTTQAAPAVVFECGLIHKGANVIGDVAGLPLPDRTTVGRQRVISRPGRRPE